MKLEKRLRHLEYDLRDAIWEATHPEPLFKEGDMVYYYENPTSTVEPDEDSRIKVTISYAESFLRYCSRKKNSIYYSPQRYYWAYYKEQLIEVNENNCTLIKKA